MSLLALIEDAIRRNQSVDLNPHAARLLIAEVAALVEAKNAVVRENLELTRRLAAQEGRNGEQGL